MALRPDSCTQVSELRGDNVHVCERCPDDEVLGAGGSVEETLSHFTHSHHSAAPFMDFSICPPLHTNTEIQQVYSVAALYTVELA